MHLWLLSEYAWEDGGDYLYQPDEEPVFPIALYKTWDEAAAERWNRTARDVENLGSLVELSQGEIGYIDENPERTFDLLAFKDKTFGQWANANYPLPDNEYRTEAAKRHLTTLFIETFYTIQQLEV